MDFVNWILLSLGGICSRYFFSFCGSVLENKPSIQENADLHARVW